MNLLFVPGHIILAEHKVTVCLTLDIYFKLSGIHHAYQVKGTVGGGNASQQLYICSLFLKPQTTLLFEYPSHKKV